MLQKENMRKLFLACLMLPLLGPAEEPSLMELADKIFSTRTPETGADEALALYEKELQTQPTSAEAQWKAARACYWLADHGKSKKEKIKKFEQGIAFAEKAVALDPKSTDAHFWLSGLYGSYGELKGVLKSLALLKPIRTELHTINRLDDHYQGGAGYRILGIVDYKVPGFAGGSKKRARELLNKALAIDPNNPFNRYYMAEFLATAAGDKKTAREHLLILKDLAVNEDVDAPDLDQIKKKGEKLMTQIGM